MIQARSHINLSVTNLDKSFTFYTQVLGCEPIAKWQTGAYLLAGNLQICLSFNESVQSKFLGDCTYLAFSISAQIFEDFKNRLIALGVKQWKESTTKSNSLYILDPDNYKLELHVGGLLSKIIATKEVLCEGVVYAGMQLF